MSSHSNFQVDRNKSTRGVNIFAKGRNFNKEKNKSEKMMEGIAIRASYYRANPQRFVREYLGIELKIFQQIILYAMMHFSFLTYIAARGQGKTFLTAIFCVTRAILYPEEKIIAAAFLRSQSREIISKIDDMRKNSPNLDREISYINDKSNEPRVEFHNGSWIKTVAASQGSRGHRSNCLIVDEYRMVSSSIIDDVLRRFQTAPRQPAYLNKEEYSHLQEENVEIYLSSAWYKSHESWDRVVSYKELMTDGKPYFVCSLPYQISIKESLLMRKSIEYQMAEKTFDHISWAIEMESMFWGINNNAFFSFDDLQKNRRLGKVYYPKEVSQYLNDKSVIIPKREAGELRVISADIAMISGAQNDASAFTVARLIPTTEGYDVQVVYSEVMEGGHTRTQSNRIRQLYYDYDCTHIVLDVGGAGIGVFDSLTETGTDTERGIEYEPLSCMNNEDLARRCVHSNAPKVIYAVRATQALNSEIATTFKDFLRRSKVSLPVLESEGEDFLKTLKGFDELPEEAKMDFRMPYVQTTLMINEILNLESETTDNDIVKIKETGSARKDRYSSISYLVKFASDMGLENRRAKPTMDVKKLFRFKQGRLM